jgi:hypothetical protein
MYQSIFDKPSAAAEQPTATTAAKSEPSRKCFTCVLARWLPLLLLLLLGGGLVAFLLSRKARAVPEAATHIVGFVGADGSASMGQAERGVYLENMERDLNRLLRRSATSLFLFDSQRNQLLWDGNLTSTRELWRAKAEGKDASPWDVILNHKDKPHTGTRLDLLLSDVNRRLRETVSPSAKVLIILATDGVDTPEKSQPQIQRLAQSPQAKRGQVFVWITQCPPVARNREAILNHFAALRKNVVVSGTLDHEEGAEKFQAMLRR